MARTGWQIKPKAEWITEEWKQETIETEAARSSAETPSERWTNHLTSNAFVHTASSTNTRSITRCGSSVSLGKQVEFRTNKAVHFWHIWRVYHSSMVEDVVEDSWVSIYIKISREGNKLSQNGCIEFCLFSWNKKFRSTKIHPKTNKYSTKY